MLKAGPRGVCRSGAKVGHSGWRRLPRAGVALAAGALYAPVALAQVAPDAGQLRQQLEQERQPVLPARVPSELAPPPEPMKDLGGARVTVNEFRVAGNTLLSSEVLLAALKPWLNRSLSFTELQNAAAEVATRYRQAGYVVRAYLPQQDVSQGMVTVHVIEARLGRIRVEGESRVSNSRLEKSLLAAQAAGQPINADNLDRALLILEDTPGAGASGVLVAGNTPATTDLLLKLTTSLLTRIDLSLDNTGSPATGRLRAGAGLTLASPLKLGDLFNANLSHTEGSDYGRLAYSLPVGYDGWRVGVNGSDMRYRLTGDAFAALNARGSSTSYGLEASYPIVRSRQRNLYLALNYDHKRFDNQANGATTSRYNTDALSAGLAGIVYDDFHGGGASSANLTLVSGKVDLSNSPSQAADAATTRSDGSFSKLRYSLSRLQALSQQLSFNALLSGQAAGKNLDSSEKFYLGGPSGVRAYPAGEGGGSEGQLLNLELRLKLPRQAQLAAFYDWGRVHVNVDNSFVGAPALNTYNLKGAGLSLSWALSQMNLRLTYARRLGSNPNAGVNGVDQDGTLIKNRVWLQAAGSF